jgi:hypothetical protein
MENNVEVLLDSNEENAIKVDEQVAVVEDPIEDLDGSDGSEPSEVDDEATAKAEELMKLISDLEVLRSYRKARHAGERKQVSKDERKKKKAKRRQANKSRRH